MSVTAVTMKDQRSATCWFVGAMSGGEDQTDRFLDEGIWEPNLEASSTMLAQVRAMQIGERIAIRTAFFRKQDLPFDAGGNTVSVMAIKAIGVIIGKSSHGGYLQVRWQRLRPAREWYFSSYQPPIWKVIPGEWEADTLIDFAFLNKPQDIEHVRNSPHRRPGFNGVPPGPNRAPSDRHHHADASRLIAFLQRFQPRDGSPGQRSGERLADDRRRRLPDGDPHRPVGLAPRGPIESNPWASTAAQAMFRGVQETLPEGFEGLPVLNNQATGLSPSLKHLQPASSDVARQGLQSGLAAAQVGPDGAFERFSLDRDAAMALMDGVVNRRDSPGECHPSSALHLHGESAPCIAEDAAFQAASSIAIQMLEERGRGAVLVGVAGIDVALEHLLHAVMGPANTRGDELFLPDRPLGHLGARVALASRLGLIDAGAERALHAMRKLRNAFAHTAASASLSDPAHRDRLEPIVAEARANPLWATLESMLAGQTPTANRPLEPALRDFILLVTLLVVFLEATAQQLRPVSPPMVMGLSGISPAAKPFHPL